MSASVKVGCWVAVSVALVVQGGAALGATNYNLTSGPVACGVNTRQTTLEPPGVINLGAATNPGTAGLQQALNAQFPGYNYAFGGNLNIVFNITTH